MGLINNETQNCIFRYTKFHSKMLTSFKIFQKLIKLPMNLNLHFVPMNVCKNSDQYLKGKLYFFFSQHDSTKNNENIIEYLEFYNLLYKNTTFFLVDSTYIVQHISVCQSIIPKDIKIL